MEYRPLGKTGMEISVIGYGASQLGNVFGETDEAEGVKAVHYAIDNGINYFDVAPMYGVHSPRLVWEKPSKAKGTRYSLQPSAADMTLTNLTSHISG